MQADDRRNTVKREEGIKGERKMNDKDRVVAYRRTRARPLRKVPPKEQMAAVVVN